MFAVLAALVVLLVILFPCAFTLFMSVHDWKVTGATPFVGLANFVPVTEFRDTIGTGLTNIVGGSDVATELKKATAAFQPVLDKSNQTQERQPRTVSRRGRFRAGRDGTSQRLATTGTCRSSS